MDSNVRVSAAPMRLRHASHPACGGDVGLMLPV